MMNRLQLFVLQVFHLECVWESYICKTDVKLLRFTASADQISTSWFVHLSADCCQRGQCLMD